MPLPRPGLGTSPTGYYRNLRTLTLKGSEWLTSYFVGGVVVHVLGLWASDFSTFATSAAAAPFNPNTDSVATSPLLDATFTATATR
jgi:hypothetical protein